MVDAPSNTEPPADLKGAGLKEWNRLLQQLIDIGILKESDMSLFTEYCYCLSDLERWKRSAARETTENQMHMGHMKQIHNLRNDLMVYQRMLCLTPVSRSLIKLPKPKQQTDEKKALKAQRYIKGLAVIDGGKPNRAG